MFSLCSHIGCRESAWTTRNTTTQQALLAPFEYTALIAGAIAGYLIWDEIPDRWVAAGAIVIIGSGLFVIYREIGRSYSSSGRSPADNPAI